MPAAARGRQKIDQTPTMKTGRGASKLMTIERREGGIQIRRITHLRGPLRASGGSTSPKDSLIGRQHASAELEGKGGREGCPNLFAFLTQEARARLRRLGLVRK